MNRNSVVFTTTTKSRRMRALLITLLPVPAFLVGMFCFEGITSVVLCLVAGIVATVSFALLIVPVSLKSVEIGDEGVLLYEKDGKRRRLLPWDALSAVEVTRIEDKEVLVFRLMALEWRHPLPEGAPPAEVLVGAIRARIRPEIAAKTDSMEAPAFFETIFHIRIPDAAKVTHAEWHADDKSGWWAVKIPKAEFLKLRAGVGDVSEWFPLMIDQRFLVGGRRIVGTWDLHGEYAISRQNWDGTPVLVWDAGTETLHGMLTRSVG